MPSPAPDFFAYMEYIFRNIPMGIAGRPQIINISASASVPREACLAIIGGAPICEALHGLTAAFRLGGTLVFAAAGNVNQDVDELKDYGFFRDESDILIPCELNGATCVAGMAWDSNQKHAASSFGSLPADGHSVDIFGPFDMFLVDDPEAADDGLAMPDTRVSRRGGTSFSSPYVAGVAALIWAADPSLAANDVERILLETAHNTSTDPKVPRWVNALGASFRSLGMDSPPFLRITTRPTSVPAGTPVRLGAVVEEIDGQSVRVEWLRGDAVFATGLSRTVDTTSWAPGSQLIRARAIDSAGNVSATDSVRIQIVPDAPPAVSRRVLVPATGTLCPIGPERGDAEFNGAPQISVSVTLRISPDANQVFGDIQFSAEGPRTDPDSSFVTERFTHLMYTAPVGERIAGISSPDRFSTRFTGRAGGAEFGFCNDGALESRTFTEVVDELVVIADTGAGDISNDADCHCDTQIHNITFQPLDVLILPR